MDFAFSPDGTKVAFDSSSSNLLPIATHTQNIFVKDLGIVLDYAKKSVFPLPLSAAAHQMFMQASAAGHGGEDDSAVVKVFPGITLPAPKAVAKAA